MPKLLNHTKNGTPGHVLSNNGYAACAVHVTVFSAAGEVRPVTNFMELHALTLAARS